MKTCRKVKVIPPIVVPWENVESLRVGGRTGDRTYEIRHGYHVHVRGQRGLWKVIRLERHNETGEGRVEVLPPPKAKRSMSRIFRGPDIIYKRPSPAQKTGAA